MRIDKTNGVRPSRNGEGDYPPVSPAPVQVQQVTSARAADAEVIVRRISAKAFIGQYVGLTFFLVLAFTAASLVMPGGVPFWMWPLGLGVFFLLWAYVQVTLRSTLYHLHFDRLEIENGIISRRIENIDLFRVRDVGLRQNIWGRMLNFGDLYIHSTDSSTPDLHVRGIDNPRGFYQQLRDRVGDSRASGQTMIVEQGGSLREN